MRPDMSYYEKYDYLKNELVGIIMEDSMEIKYRMGNDYIDIDMDKPLVIIGDYKIFSFRNTTGHIILLTVKGKEVINVNIG